MKKTLLSPRLSRLSVFEHYTTAENDFTVVSLAVGTSFPQHPALSWKHSVAVCLCGLLPPPSPSAESHFGAMSHSCLFPVCLSYTLSLLPVQSAFLGASCKLSYSQTCFYFPSCLFAGPADGSAVFGQLSLLA